MRDVPLPVISHVKCSHRHWVQFEQRFLHILVQSFLWRSEEQVNVAYCNWGNDFHHFLQFLQWAKPGFDYEFVWQLYFYDSLFVNFLLYQVLELLFSLALETGIFYVFLYDLAPITFYDLVFWLGELFFHVDFWEVHIFFLVFLVIDSELSVFWRHLHHFLPEVQKFIQSIDVLHLS